MSAKRRRGEERLGIWTTVTLPQPITVGRCLLVALCFCFGLSLGLVFPAPGGEQVNRSVQVFESDRYSVETAGVTDLLAEPTPGVQIEASETSVTFTSFGTDAQVAYVAALEYASASDMREVRILSAALSESDRRRRAAATRALTDPTRRTLLYETPLEASGSSSAVGTGVLGALAGVLAIGLGGWGRRAKSPAASVKGVRRAWPGWPGLGLGLTAALSLAAPLIGSRGYLLVSSLLLGAGAFATCIAGGRAAIRLMLLVVIAITPMRAALYSLAAELGLADPYALANTIQPALLAGAGMAAMLRHRPELSRAHPALRVALGTIALVVLCNLLVQNVGLTLFSIGAAQYLAYPVMAILIWISFDHEETILLPAAIVSLGVIVSVSIWLEAAGLLELYEATPIESGGVSRYGGLTGSYIHASVFLGATVPLALGFLISASTPGRRWLWAGALAANCVGLAASFGRAGFVIAAIASGILLLSSSGSERRRLIAVGVAALAILVPAGIVIGNSPEELVDRISRVADPDEPANAQRIDSIQDTVEGFQDSTLIDKTLGQGLAASGNAAKLVGGETLITESYFLKLLIETGLLGLLAIGAVVVGMSALMVRSAVRLRDPVRRAAAAAGVALAIHALIYPTLEVQLLAMTWWLLLVVSLSPDPPKTSGLHT